ncbi:hypothetical protein MTO96_026444 [Rhipicephalus appendiculatus]
MVDSLTSFLYRVNEPAAATELDLTNCVRLDGNKLSSLIVECSFLTSLRCLGCGFEPTDIIALLWRLRVLVEVQFSLMLKTDAESELQRIDRAAAQYGGDPKASSLRRMIYTFTFSCGILRSALRHCHDAVLADDVSVETFTFTSEVSPPVQREPRAPLDLKSCASVCANVSHTMSTGSFSCVRLVDLVRDGMQGRPPRILPAQVTLVAAQHAEGITENSILVASREHNWTRVRQLCLLLLPPEPAGVRHPTAGRHVPRRPSADSSPRRSKWIVELNLCPPSTSRGCSYIWKGQFAYVAISVGYSFLLHLVIGFVLYHAIKGGIEVVLVLTGFVQGGPNPGTFGAWVHGILHAIPFGGLLVQMLTNWVLQGIPPIVPALGVALVGYFIHTFFPH